MVGLRLVFVILSGRNMSVVSVGVSAGRRSARGHMRRGGVTLRVIGATVPMVRIVETSPLRKRTVEGAR
jgi:hypothetical protein